MPGDPSGSVRDIDGNFAITSESASEASSEDRAALARKGEQELADMSDIGFVNHLMLNSPSPRFANLFILAAAEAYAFGVIQQMEESQSAEEAQGVMPWKDIAPWVLEEFDKRYKELERRKQEELSDA
jgi:hypothetical protein